MATKKITITLDEEQLDAIRALVRSGAVANISGFIRRSVAVSLHDAEGWAELLGQALDATGGPPTAQERSWAGEILNRTGRKPPRRRRAA